MKHSLDWRRRPRGKYILRKKNPAWFKKTHGMSATLIHRAWSGMLTRCTNKNTGSYHRYGGRGIKVCKRWLKFENFLADMGEKPTGLSLDRIDNNKGYYPSNCRWATTKEQNNNRRSNVYITFQGRTMTAAQWAAEKGMSRTTLWWRLNYYKWSVEKALNTKPISGGHYGR